MNPLDIKIGDNSSKKTNTALIIFFAVVLAFVAYSVFVYYSNKKKFKTSDSSTKSAEILFFFTNWCPHCTSAKPEWNAFKEQYKNQDVNGYKLAFKEIDCTKESSESEMLMEKYKVEGYPTIKLIIDDKVIDFDAKTTKQNLIQFVNSALK